MFDFSNLSDYEFEVLSKDVLERLTGQKLRVFKQGRDGGIDVMNYSADNVLIAQVKRHTSNFYNLKKSLLDLKPKLDNIKPKTLYIVTSLGLTPQNLNEIYEMFSQYFTDKAQIIDSIRLDDLLKKNEYKDIVNKNFKLWMVASNVLSSFLEQSTRLDSSYYIDSIKEKKNIYVETGSYKKCLDILGRKKTLLITGDPGVGKSTITNMIALNYFHEGFEILFSSNRDIDSLKRIISDNSSKQLIIIDDFLGQVCMDLKSDKISELYSIVSEVKLKPNKFLILNSRITILNKASSSYSVPFNSILKKLEQTKIDLNDMSNFEKAKILYNHLYFSSISDEFFDQIKTEERYMKIINHKNFNPRIIEFVTNNDMLTKNNIKSDNYFRFVLDKLENPEDVWKNEIEQNISKSDRILLQTLYSITDNHVELEILETATNHRLSNSEGIDQTLKNFDDSLKVLNGSCIKMFSSAGKNFVSVVNPSVNDYLKSVIESSQIRKDILKNATTINQYERLVPNFLTSDNAKELVDNGRLFELDYTSVIPHYYFLQYMFRNKVVDIKYKDRVWEALSIDRYTKDVYAYTPGDYSEIIDYLFFNTTYSCYSLNDFINTENFFGILVKLDLTEIVEFVKKLMTSHKKDIKKCSNLLVEIKELVVGKIENEIIDEINGNLDSLLSDIYRENDDDSLTDLLEHDAYEMMNALIDEKISFVTSCSFLDISKKDIYTPNIDLNINIKEVVDDFLKSRREEEMYEYLAEDYSFVTNDNKAAIKDMFNR